MTQRKAIWLGFSMFVSLMTFTFFMADISAVADLESWYRSDADKQARIPRPEGGMVNPRISAMAAVASVFGMAVCGFVAIDETNPFKERRGR